MPDGAWAMMDPLSMHATDFRVERSPPRAGSSGGSFVVYAIEIVNRAGDAKADHATERVHKRWSQVEQLHHELAQELKELPWSTVAFPRKWLERMDDSHIERRVRDMNGYFSALIQLCTNARRELRSTTAFGRFLAEPPSHAVGSSRDALTPQQLEQIRMQSEDDATDAAELKEKARLAAQQIVRGDIRRALQSGQTYEAFRSGYRPVGGDASLKKVWEEEDEAAQSRGGWEPLSLGAEPLSAERMDRRNGPKRAVVSCYVNDLLSIDVVDSAFTPSLSFTLDWTDDGNVERCDDGGWQLKDGVDTDEVWRPFMDFENIVEKQDALDDVVQVFAQGGRPVMTQFRRHINTLRPHNIDLRNFPCECSSGRLGVLAGTVAADSEGRPLLRTVDEIELDAVMSFAWDSDELDIVAGDVEVASCVHDHSEYLLCGSEARVGTRRYGYFARYDDCAASYPELTVTLKLMRKPWYYIMRLVFTLMTVTLMEVVSFMLEPSALNDRFGVTGNTILATVGFHYMAAESLPKVSYLTRIDRYIVRLTIRSRFDRWPSR